MSHCYGVRCRTHQRIMESATCPERGCKGHGFADDDCDDRCPDFALEQFKDLLEASSFNGGGEGAPASAHAYLDQLQAAKRAASSITCPVCDMTSYNPNDIREGYCGNCHDWTRG